MPRKLHPRDSSNGADDSDGTTTSSAPASNRVENQRGRRRRVGRQSASASSTIGFAQPPVAPVQHVHRPIDLISDDQLESIHNASLTVLQQQGIRVLHDRARSIMRDCGAEVSESDMIVRFAPELIMQYMKSIPSEFTLCARNPAHNVRMGGDYMAFCMSGSAPNVSSKDGGRRAGNQKDFRDLLRLTQVHNVLHINGGYPVEPIDIHPSIRHIVATNDLLTLTDKPYNTYSLGAQRNRDCIEMGRIARGISSEQLLDEPTTFTIINTNSPLQLDIPMMDGVIEMASMGQIAVITPFTLAGAMAPVTIAGALVQQNAEALAGLAFSQMVRKGAPVMYGGFTSNVDMKSGSPAFGTPEYMKAQLVGGQLARKYNVPYRTSNVCAANTVDAQAAYESVFSLWGAISSGMHMLKHGAGWMEGGLCCSFEKTIMDVDLLQMVVEFLKPMGTDEDELALDAIADVGPGGHFFGTPHTQARYRNAFYAPVLSDWRNHESWLEGGRPDAFDKANAVYKERLAAYEQPPMDAAIREELDAFVARRLQEGGVKTDF